MSATTIGELERALEQLEPVTLAQIEASEPLYRVLESLLLTAEVASGGGMVASILLVDETGRHLMHGAAPNLPGAYCKAIDGIVIGPGVGSCGTAAHLGHPVYVADIERDALWADFRDLARRYGLRACWSTPIFGDRGEVIATFAVYHHTPRSPTPEELGALDLVSRAARTAILQHRNLG